MPCYDSRSETELADCEQSRQKLVRLLCEAMNKLESFERSAGRRAELSGELHEWWEEHKRLDRRMGRRK